MPFLPAKTDMVFRIESLMYLCLCISKSLTNPMFTRPSLTKSCVFNTNNPLNYDFVSLATLISAHVV